MVIIVAKAISNEKRAEIIKHMKAGASKENIAKWLFICVRTVTRVWNKFNTSGSYAAEPHGSGRKPLVSGETMSLVVAKIKEIPDITLLELIDEFKLPISESALCRRLIKLGLTYKKRHSIQKRNSVKMPLKPARNGKKTRKK
jgi:transposase